MGSKFYDSASASAFLVVDLATQCFGWDGFRCLADPR